MNNIISQAQRINAIREQFNQFTPIEKANLVMGLKALAQALREKDAREAAQKTTAQ